MRMPLAAAVRAIQHCAVETDERGGCNGLLYLSIGQPDGKQRVSILLPFASLHVQTSIDDSGS